MDLIPVFLVPRLRVAPPPIVQISDRFMFLEFEALFIMIHMCRLATDIWMYVLGAHSLEEVLLTGLKLRLGDGAENITSGSGHQKGGSFHIDYRPCKRELDRLTKSSCVVSCVH